jgi:hypothetical protein
MPGAGPVTILLPNYNIYTEYGFDKFLDFTVVNSRKWASVLKCIFDKPES